MTYRLETENKGDIPAGYFSTQVHEVRLDNSFISTSEFCEFTADIASGKKPEGVVNTLGKLIEFNYDSNKQILNLGPYEIDIDNFGDFVRYVFKGGILGWGKEGIPIFVKDNMQRIMESSELDDSKLSKVLRDRISSLEDAL